MLSALCCEKSALPVPERPLAALFGRMLLKEPAESHDRSLVTVPVDGSNDAALFCEGSELKELTLLWAPFASVPSMS